MGLVYSFWSIVHYRNGGKQEGIQADTIAREVSGSFQSRFPGSGKGKTGLGMGILKPQSPPPATHFLQQGHK